MHDAGSAAHAKTHGLGKEAKEHRAEAEIENENVFAEEALANSECELHSAPWIEIGAVRISDQ